MSFLTIVAQAAGQFLFESIAGRIGSEDLQVGMDLCSSRGRKVIPEDERIGSLWMSLDILQIVLADTEGIKELGLREFPQRHVVFLAHDSNRAMFIIWHQVGEKHSLSELQAFLWDDLGWEPGGYLKKSDRAERAGRL